MVKGFFALKNGGYRKKALSKWLKKHGLNLAKLLIA
jgi:hypothetical protein